jgi:hypothetical protein
VGNVTNYRNILNIQGLLVPSKTSQSISYIPTPQLATIRAEASVPQIGPLAL